MNDAPAESKPETESNQAARKRLRKQPPPDPAPLAGLIDAHTHLAACGGRDPETDFLLRNAG